MSKRAVVGVSDHAGWAVLVTVTPDGMLLDRRRIELADPGLPVLPHHHEAQRLPLDQGLALIERVRSSADRHAQHALDAVATAVGSGIAAIALRELPRLPPTTAERIHSYWAQTRADSVMYREALAAAAAARGWSVHWFNAKTIIDTASMTTTTGSLDAQFRRAKESFGAPWTRDHRVAMAAAIVAALRDRAGGSNDESADT